MDETAQRFEYRSVLSLKGVGPAVAEKLKRLEIYTIQDVLFHLPLRYEDRTTLVPIGALQPGQQALVEGTVEHSEIKYGGRSRRSLLCHFADSSGAIVLRFFHFNKAQQQMLAKGSRLRCFGEVRYGANRLEMAHPEFQRISEAAPPPENDRLTPVYPKTEGVHQTLLRKIASQVLEQLNQQAMTDWLQPLASLHQSLPALAPSLLQVHCPPRDSDVAALLESRTPAQQRLIFEELLAHQLSLLKVREMVKQQRAPALPLDKAALSAFTRQLGFTLTGAQEKVSREILHDLQQTRPMLRLLQGDVGSGKTVVAAIAALAAVDNDFQVAIMAPTEILAEQHYQSFCDWFGGDETPCLLLTGKDKGKKRQQKCEAIAQAKASIIIGTHALFQQDVAFNSLALLVVDEQHRFGVHQRLALREKGRAGQRLPHQLIMTATPIPRSLAMTAYADLDYSVIDALPAGRKAVATVVIPDQRRAEVIERVASACRQGEQAYWVCTLVEDSELLQCEAAETTAQMLAEELKSLRIGLVHGRMKVAEKQQVVSAFKNRQIDLLVATTVIEVGVDVPNASLMVIENAERLGLAQLHQLRGRVGRGSKQSACVLMYQSPLSPQGRERLGILRQTGNGFEVAQKDLEMRGPGEVLGTRQTGLMQMRIADLARDEHWLPKVKTAAEDIIRHHPEVIEPLVRRWLGKADRFGQV
ncbi:MAG TPA: ATP-dependent DNA helicase RecG [Thiotrichales bacterium]|nr:ATP-dependent DNA helicase RecG [Thiotrichales bacterium]